MEKLLATLREEFEDKLKNLDNSIIPRDTPFEPIANKISVFIGMRRSGKTTFLFQQIQKLLAEGITLSQILYINFEDDRLLSPDHSILVNLTEAFYTQYPENYDRSCYLFFDEIQNVENWPQVIRRFFDSKRVAIYLTGSSAKLLSTEIATSLRGRSLSTEVWPFSLHEFLVAKKETLPSSIVGKKSADQFGKQLITYLHASGFPETLFVSTDVQRRILQDYVNVVITRDIIERHGITNVTLIRYMIKTLLKNVASPFSVNKFHNDLKSQHITASKNTIYDYLQHIEDAYLLFMVPIYTESLRKTQTQPKKVYAVDPGLIQAYTLSLSPNYGHYFENLMYLDLRRRNHQIFYYHTQEGYEIDFLSKDPEGKMHLWQVVWDIQNKETLERELRALHAAEKELGIKGTLITPESYFSFITT